MRCPPESVIAFAVDLNVTDLIRGTFIGSSKCHGVDAKDICCMVKTVSHHTAGYHATCFHEGICVCG